MTVHNHTPEEGRGLECPESTQTNGKLIGECLAPEPVELVLPRYMVEHIGWLLEINHGAWSGYYETMRPYLLKPSKNTGTPYVPSTEALPIRICTHCASDQCIECDGTVPAIGVSGWWDTCPCTCNPAAKA